MQADFLDAHRRHWTDAEQLLQQQRWANADHLYGFSAECGLKRLMLLFDMPYDNECDKPVRRGDQKHADAIWTRFETYRNGHEKGPGYALPAENPFEDWRASDRYAHQSGFDEACVLKHQAGAALIAELIRKAQHEGHLI